MQSFFFFFFFFSVECKFTPTVQSTEYRAKHCGVLPKN